MSGPRVVLQSPACTAWPNEEYRPAEGGCLQGMLNEGTNTCYSTFRLLGLMINIRWYRSHT